MEQRYGHELTIPRPLEMPGRSRRWARDHLEIRDRNLPFESRSVSAQISPHWTSSDTNGRCYGIGSTEVGDSRGNRTRAAPLGGISGQMGCTLTNNPAPESPPPANVSAWKLRWFSFPLVTDRHPINVSVGGHSWSTTRRTRGNKFASESAWGRGDS